ncbi:MAG TPA: PTS transporter subunit EIIC, partial [Anaerolineales bacterium]|nr:PTS transporter subunit EIIC [Anaerolineales bacterium]
MRERLQQFGGFLAGMVIPNIGAFIAWGLITALFIPTGWIPNENFAKLVGPMILYLLPVLIGYTGGKMIHGHRGGVVGAAATMGVVVGTDIPMFLGAMIMGPLGGWLMQKVDTYLEPKVGVGFEMLVNNFSAGILGLILALFGFLVVGPVVTVFSNAAGGVVDFLVNARLLPLAAIIIEPAKVLFLNNALNHGVLAPLGVAAVNESGRAIHFLLETNPGPGLGLLLAFYVAG